MSVVLWSAGTPCCRARRKYHAPFVSRHRRNWWILRRKAVPGRATQGLARWKTSWRFLWPLHRPTRWEDLSPAATPSPLEWNVPPAPSDPPTGSPGTWCRPDPRGLADCSPPKGCARLGFPVPTIKAFQFNILCTLTHSWSSSKTSSFNYHGRNEEKKAIHLPIVVTEFIINKNWTFINLRIIKIKYIHKLFRLNYKKKINQ